MISGRQIRARYFGTQGADTPAIAEPPRTTAAAMTPSAKFIAGEAKRRIGENLMLEGDSSRLREDDLLRLIREIEAAEGEELSERERTAVVAALSSSLDHYDILTPLIASEEINDIIIRSYDDISIQIGRRNLQTDLKFPDEDSYLAFAENLLKRAGKACTLATPVVDAVPDPNIRVCITHQSFSPPGSGPMMTIRIARHRETTLEGLVRHELAPRPVLEYLAALVERGSATLLIAGEVGTGKTTLVRALASRIRADEAVLIIEDTHEITLSRPFTRTLLTREANTEGAGRISPAQAVRTGMRMAMNRVLLGEMRDAETAEAFVDVCASGHPGMSTIHARSARDAVSRLELFLSRAQPGVTMETARRQIADAISVVVYLGLDSAEGRRRVLEVLEVGSSSDGAVQLSPIFTFCGERTGSAEWLRGTGVTAFREALTQCDYRLASPGTKLVLDPEDLYTERYT